MNNLKKILPIALTLIAMFILTACNAPITEEPVKESTSIPNSTQVSDKTLDTNTSGSRYGTDLKCSQLKGEANRQTCESQINDVIGNMIENEIISSFDAGRCKELPAEVAEYCQTFITETGVTGPVSSEEIAIFDEAIQGTFPEPGEDDGAALFFPVYDSANCAKLTTPGYKAYCEKQITQQLEQVKLDQIIQSGDVKGCDELSDDMIIQCKIFFGEEVLDDSPDLGAVLVPPVAPDLGAVAEPVEAPIVEPVVETVAEPVAPDAE